ncbi:MAG: sulfatase [Candidatus Sumerlaeota bacterium]|nr:sulfatase [Candidatus Sumerlaeota bacterium]
MKAIIVMYDSLNRHFLPPYGCDWVVGPNFSRLAERAVAFDNCYIGSSPTIPTRREIHTGRYNFLHRGWAPLEPFDDSMPEILKQHGVYTHLASDCQHYWEDGGATYHGRYNTWEFSRGQEGDAWKGDADPTLSGNSIHRQDIVNRRYVQTEEQWPQSQTFDHGIEFIRTNKDKDRWMVQIETFDPHEPFYAPQKYRDLYPHPYDGPQYDWPIYGRVTVPPEQVRHLRFQYASLVSFCDASLGRVLDLMDELDLWKDTMLILNTDHGHLIGEHNWLGKMIMPYYNEVAHIPLLIWDPRCGARGQRRSSLVQTIDLAPTLLEYFGVDIPPDMQGKALKDVIASDARIREAGLFGQHSQEVHVTDGRYVYMHAPATPDNQPLFDYTLMFNHMRERYRPGELRNIELAEPFTFTKGCRTVKIRAFSRPGRERFPSALYDLEADPGQEHPITDATIERRMIDHLVRLMKENDAPPEQFQRLGL